MKIDYDDLALTMKYLEKYCKGESINIETTIQNRLEIKSFNHNREEIMITVYLSGQDGKPTLMPTISKVDKLKNSI